MDFSVEIISRNLATTSNFVGFRGGRDFTFFEAWGVGEHMTWIKGCHIATQKSENLAKPCGALKGMAHNEPHGSMMS